MAINASQVTNTQSLEEFRLEFNKLQGDVEILKDNPTFTNQLVFEGATADAFETTFTVTDPTADRTVTLPDATGTLLLTGQSSLTVANNGTIGSVGATDAMTIASNGVITFGARPVIGAGGITVPNDGQVGSVGATDAMIIASSGIVTFKDDILIKDGGTIGSASATTAITVASTGIVTFVDDILIKNDGTIGSAGTAAAMTISSGGIVTFADDILIKDGGTIGVASTADAMTVSSAGIVTFKDDILIKDGGTIGTATDADAITIAAAGAVTLSQRSVHSAGITLADDGQIGSASDTDAIAISSAGVVTLSSTTASSSKTTGALVVAGGIGTSADLYVGDLLSVEGDIHLSGSNKELRFYEGANYVGFEAPALSADQIFVLPPEDGSNGQVLATNGSGALSFSTAVSGAASVFVTTANNTANETVFPVFVDGATGSQGAETDTGLTYNPSTGLMTMAKLLLADNGTIGSASSTSAITISSGGVVTFVDDIIIKDGGTIGSA